MLMNKRQFFGLLLALPALLGAALAAPAPSRAQVATDNVKARLISEVRSIGAGDAFWVGLEFDIRDGWHTYWRNPGDSGQATKLTWSLPPGFSAGEIVWTTPHRFDLPPLVNYGYAKHALHLVRIQAPADLKPGTTVSLSAKAGWLVCSDVCIPESADLQLTLPVAAGHGAIDGANAAVFAAARNDLPMAAPAAAAARIQGDRLILRLGADWGPTLSQIQDLSFLPFEEGSIEYGVPGVLTRTSDGIELSLKLGYQPPAGPSVAGVLLATESGGAGRNVVPLEISAPLQGAGTGTASRQFDAATPPAAADAPGQPPATPPLGLAAVLLLAVLGGLVLNLMPCVFPVLSIKAIGLAEQAKKHPAAVRAKGLVFAAGVIGSMLCLAAVLLALRAGGEQIGWGFQLQSPLFVTLMAYLLLAVGLNLSGVFEVGGGLAGIGDGLTQGDGYRASFFTGVLTTLVATPCTAPFMAAAVGWALTQPPALALTIFATLGLGLSLPYLLLSFAPWLRRALPKPGAWMDRLKQIFAFPMYASAAWLLWVLAQQQTGPVGLAAGFAGVVLIGLAAWSYQQSKGTRTRRGHVIALATAGGALLIAIALPVQVARAPAAVAAVGAGHPAEQGGDGWQPYDAARLETLKASGKPVLVNFTASWCLTCLVNERNAFADAAVQAVFHDKGVTLMKGDWTNRDPAITAALAEFKRAGVPLYVVYNAKPGSTEAVVLPQLLSAGIVQDAFAALPGRAAH
jgi:thiol:disulfide interchange protein DsbD